MALVSHYRGVRLRNSWIQSKRHYLDQFQIYNQVGNKIRMLHDDKDKAAGTFQERKRYFEDVDQHQTCFEPETALIHVLRYIFLKLLRILCFYLNFKCKEMT